MDDKAEIKSNGHQSQSIEQCCLALGQAIPCQKVRDTRASNDPLPARLQCNHHEHCAESFAAPADTDEGGGWPRGFLLGR